VVRIDENDFKVFVNTILVDPVRVEHAKISASSTDTLLGHRTQSTLELELIYTLANGFTKGSTWITNVSVSSHYANTDTDTWLLG
jgi:hypothetical protein